VHVPYRLLMALELQNQNSRSNEYVRLHVWNNTVLIIMPIHTFEHCISEIYTQSHLDEL